MGTEDGVDVLQQKCGAFLAGRDAMRWQIQCCEATPNHPYALVTALVYSSLRGAAKPTEKRMRQASP